MSKATPKKRVSKKTDTAPAANQQEVEVCCKNCDVAVQLMGDSNWFECHRFPAVIRVFRSHWCAEFKAREET